MKTLVIINPCSRSAKKSKLEAIIRRRFASLNFKIAKTSYPGHAAEIAIWAVRENYDTVVAVGGDGTVNEVVNGIFGSNITLGIIPAGTANDLATYCDLTQDIQMACDAIINRQVRSIDVIEVNGYYFVTSGGVGFPAVVAAIANSIKSYGLIGRIAGKIFSSRLYVIAALWAIFIRYKRQNLLKVGFNGASFNCNAFLLLINNQPFLGKQFLVAPGAVNNDGKFDVCLIENHRSRWGEISILLKVLSGKHVGSQGVKVWQADDIVITGETPQLFLGDGEVLGKTKECKIRLIPHALNVIVPTMNS